MRRPPSVCCVRASPLSVAAVLLLTGCGSGDSGSDTAPAAAATSGTPKAAADPPSATPAPAEPSPNSPACLEYPLDLAAEFLKDPDTGEQIVPGEIIGAAAAMSPEPGFQGRDTYAIAIVVGDQAVLLAHPVPDGQDPLNGGGLYAPLDPRSAEAVPFPLNAQVVEGVTVETSMAARDCALG